MVCPHIDDLNARLKDIKRKFLAHQLREEKKGLGTFTADPRRIAAFRLLVHAELEEYLETKGRDGLRKIKDNFAAGKKTVRENVQLFVIARAIDHDLNFKADTWEKDVAEVCRLAEDWISKNNGIKYRSFVNLAIFSGKMPDEIDYTLAADLNSFGSARGDVAHKSSLRVRNLHAPSDELKRATDIVKGLAGFFT
ncbi:hypothetical protein [Achromobacter insolitus]|uniref:hypothetical protein n=1 Tax=Achromobacter insolitus TaxID=217204 RepID=UPI0028AB0A75|nr:hypothetical protein [Achromobacter insolitus]